MLTQQINQLRERIKRLDQSGGENSPEALAAFHERWRRLNERLECLPLGRRLAISHIMYNELEEVVMRFELLAAPSTNVGRTADRKMQPRWN